MNALAQRPNKVLLIRHGEKLGDPSNDEEGGPNLSVLGSARAAGLPTLFLPAAFALSCQIDTHSGAISESFVAEPVAGHAPRFDVPDYIIATADSKHSSRPRQTVTPTALALGKPFNCTAYLNKTADIVRMATDIKSDPKYVAKIIVICWHHGSIQALAQQLGAKNAPAWPGKNVFDRVWIIDFNNEEEVDDQPQRLLFTDNKD